MTIEWNHKNCVMISIPIALKNTSDVPDSSFSEIRPELELHSFMFVPVCYTLCPNKSDQIADLLTVRLCMGAFCVQVVGFRIAEQ